MRSWLHETTRQFLLYLLVGLGFIPFGLVYALLRTHHLDAWYVLVLPMVGGLALGLFIRARFESKERAIAIELLKRRHAVASH